MWYREERENGFYDEGGNYVFKKEHVEVDAWVAELSETTMEQQIGEVSRAYKKKRQREEELEKLEANKIIMPLNDIKLKMLEILQSGETVAKAMKRLSTHTQLKSNWQQKTNNNRKEVKQSKGISSNSNNSNNNNKPISNVDLLIEYADTCISEYGIFGIYTMSREALVSSCTQWEYRIIPVTQESTINSSTSTSTSSVLPALFESYEIHGPFTSEQIANWKNAGYFNTSTVTVYIRKYTPMSSNTGKKVTMNIFDEEEEEEVHSNNNNNSSNNNTEPSQWVLLEDIDFGEYITVIGNEVRRKQSKISKFEEENEDDEVDEEEEEEEADEADDDPYV